MLPTGAQVLAAAVPETLGAGLDHGEHITLVDVRGEALLNVTRVQHLDVAQRWRLPKVCLLAQCLAHASQLRKRKKINMLTSMLSTTLRVNSTKVMAASEPSR